MKIKKNDLFLSQKMYRKITSSRLSSAKTGHLIRQKKSYLFGRIRLGKFLRKYFCYQKNHQNYFCVNLQEICFFGFQIDLFYHLNYVEGLSFK
jgi:hypothetical protein